MKRIIIYCQKHIKNCKQVNKSEFLKLRLRGKGSGFKEGPEGKGALFFYYPKFLESLEPMHLCVSSKYMEVYKMACGKIEELLNKLYLEYANFCKKMGTDFLPIHIKRIDDDENLNMIKTEEN